MVSSTAPRPRAQHDPAPYDPARYAPAHYDPAQYFLMVILDIEGFGRRTDPDQAWLRDRLRAVVARAIEAAGVPEPSSEDRGDALVLFVPGTVPKTDLLGGFVRALVHELREHSRNHTGDREMRLRVAVHAGEVARHGAGWVGADLNTAFRMADMQPLRRALAGAPGAVLSLAVSHVLHQGVVRHGHPGLEAAEFAPAVLSAKEIRDETVWIRVPGHPWPPGLRTPGPRIPGPSAPVRPAPPAPPNCGISGANVSVTGVGVNHGTVTQSWTGSVATGPAAGTADIPAELTRLRAGLTDARQREVIDDFTFQATGEELETAEQHARAQDEEGRGRLLRALMKIERLIPNAAALAGLIATVTQLIQHVKGQA
ncbi:MULTISPECIES: hypothetical protein [Streptomyces]|uniref:hypothetical protein n=1 Tax=Streptomyces TaxID=1883 RepID=UPI0006965E42|nr:MULTISPECIES: hypothetical protein [unclassified Streptomyces]UJV42155.1 hypothetical protein CVT30_21930 [Streptomyces sp. AMCC400023]